MQSATHLPLGPVTGSVLHFFQVEEEVVNGEMEVAPGEMKSLNMEDAGSTHRLHATDTDNGVVWQPGYTMGGHQMVALSSLLLCGLAGALLRGVDVQRGLRKTAAGAEGAE